MVQAQDLMTKNLISCQPLESAWQASQTMKRMNVGIVPVLDRQKKCVGILTDRDLCIRVLAERRDPDLTTLSEIMSEDLACCEPEADLESILKVMYQKQVKRVLVVNQQEQCLGIISKADILQYLHDSNQFGKFESKLYR